MIASPAGGRATSAGAGRPLAPVRRTLKRLGLRRSRFYRTGVADLVARASGHEVLTILGDSHSEAFRTVAARRSVRGLWIDSVTVPGATAFGLANPNSATDALGIFDAALRHVPRHRKTLSMLGEVDCGYLAWLRADRHGTSVDDELDESLRRYTAYLDGLRGDGRDQLGIVSVPLPTVEDYATWGGLDNARQHVRSTMDERTTATRAYNAALRAWAAAHGVAYLDLESDMLDRVTGRVSNRYRNADPLDHHLDRDALSALIVRELPLLRWPLAAP